MNRARWLGALIVIAMMAGEAAAQERALRVVSPWVFNSLEPTETGFIMTRMGAGETLVGVEPDGRLVGLVAESWRVEADRLTWRFAIRAGMRFHDGEPVTPAAVVNSLTRARANSESLSNAPIESIAADGADVVIRTATPFGPLPSFLVDYATIIISPRCIASDGRVTCLAATGYYRLDRVVDQTRQEFSAFDGYWGERAPIARAVHLAVPEGETRANLAASGEAELAYTLLPVAAARINAGGRARVESVTIPRLRMIVMNAGLPFFDDPRARRAISLAIDRAGIAQAILRHPASAATQLFPPLLRGWHQRDLPALRQDVAEARRLLAELGWRLGRDGILERDGRRFSVRALTFANRPELPVMAAAIQAQLREIGIEIAIEPSPPGRVPAAQRDGSLEMALVSRTYVNVPDPIGTIIPDFTRDRSLWAAMNWRHDEIRRLVPEYVGSFDDDRRAAIQRRVAEILQDELPVIPVSWTEHTVAVANTIAGVEVDPFEMSYRLNRVRWAR